MPSSSELDVLETGLCASWTRQVALSGGGRLSRVGGLLVAISAVPDQTQQVAVVERPVLDPESSVLAAEALFVGAGWDPAFDLAAGAHPHLEEVLESRGYRVVIERPGMVRSLDVHHPSADGNVLVATAAQLKELARVQSRAFDMPLELCERLLPSSTDGMEGLEVLVVVDSAGGVVGGLSLHVDGAIAGIVGAAIEPARQREGLGSALSEVALARAGQAGAQTAWLQSTPAGSPLWRSVGFIDVASFKVWLVSHHPPSELRLGRRPTGL